MNKDNTLGQFSKIKYSEHILQTIKEIHYTENKEIVEVERGKVKFEFWFLSEKLNTLDKKNQEELFFEVSNRTLKFKRGWSLKELSSLKYQFKEDFRGGMRFTLLISFSKNYIITKFEDIHFGNKHKHSFIVKFVKRFNQNYFKNLPKQHLKF